MAKLKELRPCVFAPNCPNKIGPKASGICHTCYAGIWYHRNLGIAHILKYTAKIAKLHARTELMVPSRKRVKVAR